MSGFRSGREKINVPLAARSDFLFEMHIRHLLFKNDFVGSPYLSFWEMIHT